MSKTRMGKRVASLLLSLVMMLSLLPTTVYANMTNTGETKDAIVEETTTPDANAVEDTGDAEPADEGEGSGDANVSEGEDGDAADVSEGEGNIADPQDGEAETPVVYADEGETPVSAAVSKVGDNEYATLTEAVEAAQSGETVSLLGDVELTDTLTVTGKDVTLDVGKFTLTVATSGDGISVENATLTLAGEGKYVFDCTARYSDGIYVYNTDADTTSTLNLNGDVDINVNGNVNSAIHAYASAGKAVVNINAGMITARGSNQFPGVVVDQNATLNMTGGTFDLSMDFDTYSDGNDVVGVLIWANSHKQENCAVNISGGTFKVGGKNAFAQAVQVGMSNGYSENCTVKISGGEVILNQTENGKGYVYATYKTTYATAEITGGTVSGNVTAIINPYIKVTDIVNDGLTISGGNFSGIEVDEKYLAEGCTYDSATGKVSKAPVVVATIGENGYATLAEAIEAAKDGDTIVVNAGEYTLPSSQTLYVDKAFTIEAAKDADVSFDMTNAVTLGSAKVTFEGVTFNYKTNGNYIGLQHADTLVYNNCTINGMVFLYAASETFNNCTFNQTSADAYNVWTYGAQNVVFNGCTFNCVGKAVLVYNEGANDKTDLTVADTKFVASAPVEGKAAIEIDTSLMEGGATITVDEKTTAAGFATGSNSGDTLWNDKKQTDDTNKDTTVIVAGETVFEPHAAKIGTTYYKTLDAAIEAASAGDTIVLLANAEVTASTLSKGVTIKSEGENQFEIKGLTKIAGTGVKLENVYLNLTGTLDIGGTNTALTNCTIRAKDLDWDWGNANPFESGTYNTDPYNYLTKVTGTNVTLTGCAFDGRPSDGSYFRDLCLAYVTGTDVTMKDCSFYEGTYACGAGAPKGTWTLDGCKFNRIYHDCIELVANAGGPTVIVNDCDLVAACDLNDPEATVKFTNCRFDKTPDHDAMYYCVYSYGTTVFDNCTFTADYKRGEENPEWYNGLYFGTEATVEINNTTVADAKITDLLRTETSGSGLAAIDATKDADGKYTGGTFFAGNETAIKNRLSAGLTTKKNDDGTFSVVAKPGVAAKIGDTTYASLDAAIKAASTGDTITLLVDVDLGSGKIGFYKSGCENLTFDLNGHTITSAIADYATGTVVVARAGLVIKNGTIENTYAGTGGKDSISAIYVTNGGTTTLENVTLRSNYSGLYVCQLSSAVTVVVNVEEDTVISGGKYGVKLEAPKGTSTKIPNVTLNVNGGTITGADAGVHATSPSSSKYGAVNVNITAGTVNGVTVDTKTNAKNPVKLDITGGTINGQLNGVGDVNVITVSGGTFENPVDPAYCAEGYTPVKNSDGTYGVEKIMAAQIGETKYATLAEAFANAKDGDTITLLTDCSGNGIVVEEGTFTDKGLIVDFNDHTYTVGGVLVGSATTGTNAFQLLQDNKITFQNGMIEGVAENTKPAEDTPNWHGAPAMVIQNYCDLTLTGMTISGGDETVYTMSNNCGNVEIVDTTINAGKAKGYGYGPFAFDACGYNGYDGVSVTVKGNSVINGNIEVSRSASNKDDVKLTLESGTISGVLKIDSSIKSGDATTVTKSNDVTLAAPDGYLWNAEGVLKEAVAQVGEEKFETLQAAFDAAKTGDTVTLLRDITLTEQVNITQALDGLTLDGNNKTITCATTTDPFQSGGSALYFGDTGANKRYCTGVKIKDLTMTGMARYGIFLYGGTTTEFTNVNISGEYYIAVNLYGTHGATMTNCNISNSTVAQDIYGSAIWSNVASQNPLKLVNSKVDVIAINTYTTANKLEPKIFIDENSSAEIHTLDDGSVSGNKRLCVSLESEGRYTIKEYVNNEWVTINVAKVDGVGYETLQAASDAAKGGSTVRLLNNVVLAETAVFPADKTVHINLQGYNITATGTALRINGKTDIQSTGGVGTIESTGHVAVAVGDNAKVTVYSGVLKGREGAVITGESTGATIEIRKNATLIATDNAVIAGNGSKRDGEPNTILVKGGTFEGGIVTEGYIACGIYAPWNDNVTVSGGTFNIKNGAGIVARAGTVKVTGGTFNCGNGTAKGWVGDSKNEVPNAALVFDEAANYPALTESSQILVSGGSFSTDPAANGATLAAGYVANENADGMYEVAKENPAAAIGDVKYDTLQAAITAAQAMKDGATITLLTDINTSSYYEVKGESPVTIDLNKHNITSSGASGVFYVTAKGDLTITGEGTVTAVEKNNAAMAVWVYSPEAKVTLEGGTYKQEITNKDDTHFDLIFVTYGNVYVKGGTYEGFTPAWTLNCKDASYQSKEAKIEVTGGTFKGFDPANNTAEGENTSFVAAGYVSTVDADGSYTVTEKYLPVEVWTGYTGEKKGSYATVEEAVENLGTNKWIVIGKDYTLDEDFTIPEGVFLDVAKDATLTVAEGVTLTVAANAKRLGVRTGATLVNNGTIMVLGTSNSNGYVMVQDGANFDVAKLSVPEDHFLDYNGSNYFATANADAAFEIVYSDGTTKKAKDLTNITGATKVTLLKDVTGFARSFDSMDKLGDNFVLDLGGHTLSGTTTASTPVLQISVPMTIQNGTIKNVSENEGPKANPGALKTYADVTIASDAIIDGGSVGYAIWTAGYGHTLTVNGTVTSNGDYAITGNGSNEYDGATIDIDDCNIILNEGAVISADNGIAIYHPELGTVTVNGGTIAGHTGIEMCAGKLVVNGGSITSTGDDMDATGSQNAILDGAAISIINRNYPGGVPTAVIKGGTFKATGTGMTVKAYDYTGDKVAEWTAAGDYVNISGGTFSSIPTNMDALCADGYTATQNEDSSYTVTKIMVAEVNGKQYATLPEAIAAADAGDTVKLIANFTTDASRKWSYQQLWIRQDVTLDLNGYTMTIPGELEDSSNWSAFFISGGTLTVKDSTKSTGAIIGADKTEAGYSYQGGVYLFHLNGGNLVIENGTYYAGCTVANVENGTATINGGAFSVYPDSGTKDSRYLLNCIDKSYKNGTAHIIVNGGTFVGYDPRNNAAEGAGTSFVAEGVGVDADGSSFTAKANMAVQLVDADGNSVAAYDSVSAGIEEATDGQTAILLADATNYGSAFVSADITVDFNGKTVTNNANPMILVQGSADVVLKNGAIACSAFGEDAIWAAGSSKLALNSMTLTSSAKKTAVLWAYGNAEVTIDKDSSIITTGSGPAIFFGSQYDNADATPTVNIYGRVEGDNAAYLITGNGSYNGTSYINIYDGANVKAGKLAMFLPQMCEVNMEGGTVEGYCGIGIKSGTLNISGGQVLGVGTSSDISDDNSSGNGMSYDGSAILIDSHTGYKGDVKVNISGNALIQSRYSTGIREIGNTINVTGLSISGGTVLSGNDKEAVLVRDETVAAVGKFITGGSFSTDVKDYCVETYTTVYDTDADMYNVVKQDAKITVGKRLLIGNNLTITYLVNLTGCSEPWVEFEFYSDETKTYTTREVRTYGTESVTGPDGKPMEVFTFDFTGINPQRMTDTLRATVYAKDGDGNTVEYQVGDYSVAQYCSNKLAKISENDSLRMLIGNLVAYGAASQEYMNYHLNMKVSDSVTGTTPTVYDKTVTACAGTTHVDGSDVTIKGKTLVLSNAFAIRVYFTLADGVDKEQVSFNVTTNAKQAAAVTSDVFEWDEANNCWYFDYANLNATQLDSKVMFTADVNGTAGDTLEYSVNTYLAKVLDDSKYAGTKLYDLCYALFHYGWACQAYAGSN